MSKKAIANITIIIILCTLGLFGYVYLNVPTSGSGGIVSTNSKNIGQISFKFSVYGAGKGDYPLFDKPMSVATDKDNNIYVSDTSHDRIIVFNSRGQFMFEFGTRGVAYPAAGVKASWEPGKFNFPYGIAIDDQTGNIFVADLANKRIQIFNSTGNFIDWFPKGEYGGQALDINPLSIAIKKGQVYIANPYNIVIFTTDGKFVKDFGMPGNEPGQFNRPNGIAVDDNGTVYVSDSLNNRLQALDPNGKSKWVLGERVDASQGMNPVAKKATFEMPRNIAIGPDGNIYVVDAFDFSIKVVSPEGKLLTNVGERGVADGTFNFPSGIAITKDGMIYVVEKENNRVQALRISNVEESEQ